MILSGKTDELGEESNPEPFTTYVTWIDPSANQGLIGDRLVTNCLSHGMALPYGFPHSVMTVFFSFSHD
jgi:hypothetical protein